MTNTTNSRDPVTPTPQPMMSDVLAVVLSDQTHEPQWRDDTASGVRTVGKALEKVLGKSLAQLPAHPGFLRDQFARISHKTAGLTPARWANAKSLTRRAIKQAGLAHRPGRYHEPLSPDWAALFARLDHDKDRTIKIGLSRLAHYCSAEGITPPGMADSVMTAFLRDTRMGMLGKPRKSHRTVCKIWNKAVDTIEGWPAVRVTVPSYSQTYALPRGDLLATLTADIDAYLAREEDPGVLNESEREPLRPRTIATHRQHLHAYVSALIRHGHAADQFRTLADVIHPDKVRDGLRFIIAHARAGVEIPKPETGKECAHHIARTLMSVARYWVEADAATLAGLRGICRTLKSKQRGMKDKNRLRLRQFDDPDAVDRLVTMPERLMDRIRRIRTPSIDDALEAQLAIAVELLLMVPMRPGNLRGLVIGGNLLPSRKGIWRVAFLGDETKTDAPLDAILPAETSRLLDEYRKTYRPLLMHGESDWLFPGRDASKPKSEDMLRSLIVDGVWEACALVVHPHLFRHIAAKLYLEAHDGAYGVVRLALGHKSMNTTTDSYCGTEGAHALAHFDAHILALRARAKKSAAFRRGQRPD